MPNMGVSPIEFDYTQPTNQQWKDIIKQHLQTTISFEIHCWEEETKWIDATLQYGELKETEWSYTPFFSIFLDSGFSSEHYGTELYQLKTVEENK